jgi:ATP-dependent exoDNAse (exonuclease V) beta subunit
VFDVIFIDEAQDQSVSQIKLLLNCLAPNGRVIAVGDSRQAIYAFRGAASNSMELLRNELNGAAELPLSVCYRCGSEIVKLAATIVPQIECSTSTPAGEVTSTDSDSAVSAIEDGDFYIARTNAQVIDFAFALYRAGKPFRLQGREFADVLIWEIVKAANHGVESNRLPKAAIVKSTDSFLHHKTAENLSTRLAATSEAKSTLRDTIHTALSFLNNATSIADASELIRAFFAGDTGATLSTVHRVKGLEANTVYCAIASLGADAFYGARPRLARTEEGAKGEENIRYVAYTRAKRKLVLVS